MLGRAAAFAALLLASPGAASAHGSVDDRGLIVAERHSPANGGNPQIVAVNPATGALQVLTTGNADTSPDLSPDGRTLVFGRCPRAVRCDDVGTQNIWLMRSDGTHQHPLTTCDATRCLGAFKPAFSPDGRRIAFSEDLLDENGINHQGIFTMRIDGTDVRRVTSRSPEDLPDGDPQFSPDGRRLVFTREVPGGARLFTVDVDGRNLRPLLPDINAFLPAWSPNGQRVAFTRFTQAGTAFRFDIVSVRPNGRHVRQVTDEPPGNYASGPDYSPTGRRLVFTEFDGTDCHLVMMSAKGRHSRTLPTGPGCLANASWGAAPGARTP
jgi:Tol biopolymer transport system component